MDSRILASLLGSFLVLLPGPFLRAAGPFSLEAVSLADPKVASRFSSPSHSGDPQLTPDGQFIVFASDGADLVLNDFSGAGAGYFLDVFLKNLHTGEITLVSVRSDGARSGNGPSSFPLVSVDARFVIFESEASDLVSITDLNQQSDVFRRDVRSGQTTLVSVNEGGIASGNARSALLDATPDGRYVLFDSYASDLVPGDTNGASDYFLRDLQLGKTWLISPDPGKSSSQPTAAASLSANGRYVALTARPSAQPPGPITNGGPLFSTEIYLWDRETDLKAWISSNASFNGAVTVSNSTAWFVSYPPFYQPALSADARFVAFKSRQGTNVTIFRYDVSAGLTAVIATNLLEDPEGADNPLPLQISQDGRYVLYEKRTLEAVESLLIPGRSQLYLWDAQNGESALISVAADGVSPGDGSSDQPRMTPDAKFVTFLSDAGNFVASSTNDSERARHVYLRDVGARSTKLVTLTTGGAPARAIEAMTPDLSDDGQVIALAAFDTDLVAGDNNLGEDVFVYSYRSNSLQLVSGRNPALTQLTANNGSSLTPNAVSTNGQLLVFVSNASDLVANRSNSVPAIVLRDLVHGTNRLVSVPEALGAQFAPVISANGQKVVFASDASNLTSFDFNRASDLFVRDLATGRLELVSVRIGNVETPDSPSSLPSLSADGRYVAFQTRAVNMVTGLIDTNGGEDIFVRDLELGANIPASITTTSNRTGDAPSFSPVISPDGRYVLFTSRSTDLVSSPRVGVWGLFLRDLKTASTERILSAGQSAGSPIGGLAGPQFSGDGNWVITDVYYPWDLGTNVEAVVLHSISGQTNLFVCTNCFGPSVSADTSRVAYIQNVNQVRQIFVFDRIKNARYLVSANLSGTAPGNDRSIAPVISSDGRFVAFESRAGDLVAGDLNGLTDIYLRDLLSATTILVSRRGDHAGAGQSLSINPAFGADGRTIFFESFSSDLVAGDFNENKDIFRFQFTTEDSDNDGLPDFWETAWFGNLAEAGDADSDGDGHSNLQEYQAGTNPRQPESALRLTASLSSNGAGLTLAWPSVPGKSYQLQSKSALDSADWTDLRTVTPEGFVGSASEQVDQIQQRFYRVTVAP